MAYLFDDSHVITVSWKDGRRFTFVRSYRTSLSAILRRFHKRFPDARTIEVNTLNQYLLAFGLLGGAR